ncbi:MAG: DUF58 domain-containing protein [Deltaproteobacteria bacterium]|nr:DUF58 domain-containing protein [Deltaproteobacteria bacterium]MCW5801521.1 DUF58 domain-containing protein [Deltaproteobacteria bacterium]
MRPTLRCLVLFLAGIPLSLGAVAIHARLWSVWFAYVCACVALAGFDAVFCLAKRKLRVAAHTPEQIFIGESATATIELSAGRRGAALQLLAELDPDLAPQPPISVEVRAAERGQPARGTAQVRLVPRRRGSHALRGVHVRWSGPLGLIEKRRAVMVDRKVDVVPNLGAVRAIALRMFADHNFFAGLKVEKFLGDGSEFESLREYVPGLDHRAIDWRASARHRKLLCQEFRAERNHQVVLAVDGGQLMSEPVDGVPKLDHAINAAILLGWFCLRTGDRVGMLGFDERVRQWAEPAGGMHTFQRLQALSADIGYRHVETNYTLTLAELSTRLRRRSLVVLFTDFLDTVTAELMIDNVTRLARRHLVLFVAVRDPSLETRALARPGTMGALHEAVVASDFARERHVVLERLRRAGAHCIDTAPATFSMALVNRYLDIKRRELY